MSRRRPKPTQYHHYGRVIHRIPGSSLWDVRMHDGTPVSGPCATVGGARRWIERAWRSLGTEHTGHTRKGGFRGYSR